MRASRRLTRRLVPLGAAAIAVVAIGAAACSDDSSSDSTAAGTSSTPAAPGGEGNGGAWPATAPAFTADQLNAAPTTAWLTNGGSLNNQRYSPLTQINADNVSGLKGEWVTDLKSGTAAKYSAEGQPIAYNGKIYIPTGEDDVFRVDVATGKIDWKYESNINQKITTVCCGWLSRGVAIGDGMVYIGQLDGNLVALDQDTGKVAWKTKVGDWRKGYTITHAPLYYDGMVVTGVSGGEFSIRGRVQAYDAKTGKQKWVFHTIPDKGEVGGNSWPANNDSRMHGGSPMWQTPSVDPELGLMYFSTGNANPDLDGSKRAGDNLFATSVVAIDAKTGKYKWHFQQVRHDIWDYDAPSPTVLFDAEFNGEKKKVIAETGKTGWTYVLDRETGKPLLPVKDMPVPQLAAQKTAKTQPIPQYDPWVPHEVTAADVADVKKIARSNGHKEPVVGAKTMYTPFGSKAITVVAPGPQGGNNWQPMSYNQGTGYLYICSMRSVAGLLQGTTPEVPKAKRGGVVEIGSVFTTTGFGDPDGYFGAWDPTTGKAVWRHKWDESCYSGSTTTAGNLVFVGRNNGELQAYDATTGDEKWSFQTGAGANSTVSVFEYNGKQYISFLAGGNALAGSAHGANLWLFSLDGTLGPVKAGSAAASVSHAGENEGPVTGNAAAGRQVFLANCAGCHGANGKGANGGPTLKPVTDKAFAAKQVTNGGKVMPAFKDSLSKKEIADVAAYVATKAGK